MNPDDVFSIELAKRLGKEELWDERCYYRADKIDFTNPLTDKIHPSKYERECRKSATVVVGENRLANSKKFWKEWDEEAKTRAKEKSVEVTWPFNKSDEYFTSSSGDFFALPAERFKELKGHPEIGSK